jgi:FkbM family methyltransferase
MHNGIRTYTNTHYGSYNLEVIRRLRGHHEPQEELVFSEVLKRIPSNGSMIELGSFWAYYSLWFLKEIENGKTILVEPVPSALRAGQLNFELNDREGTFVRAAVGAHPASEAPIELWRGRTEFVATTTVDELMSVHDFSSVNLLHADIQGAEVSMLHGARGALEDRAIEWMFISTHGENIHQKCLQVIRRFGYRIHVAHTPAESFSVDGLIVAGKSRSPLTIGISRRASWRSLKAKCRAKIRVEVLERVGAKPVTT